MIVHGEGERYVVSEMRGVTVGAEPGTRGTLDYAVLDSHYCYEQVARYTIRGDRSGYGGAARRNRAVRCADRLNAAERGNFLDSLRHYNGTLACDGCGRRVSVARAVLGHSSVMCPDCAEVPA